MISATFLSAICAFLNMSQNFFVGWLVDIVRFSDLSMRQDQLNWITFVLLAIYIADALLALFSGVLYTIAASRCSCRLRSLVLRNMLRQDVAFFDTVRIGELLNRLSTDTEVIQSVVTSNLVGWFIPSVQVIIGFVICFWYVEIKNMPCESCLASVAATEAWRSESDTIATLQVLVAVDPGDPLGHTRHPHCHVPAGYLHEGAYRAGAVGACGCWLQGR